MGKAVEIRCLSYIYLLKTTRQFGRFPSFFTIKNIFQKNRKKVLTNAFLFVIISNVAGNAAAKLNAGVAQWQSS